MELAGKLVKQKFRRRVRRISKAAVAVTSILMLVAIIGYYTPCRVTRHTIHLRNLPSELDGLTVAHLSDLHYSMLVREKLIRSAISSVDRVKPDIVVMTGDYVSRNAQRSTKLAEMLSGLEPRLGMYAVLGNHDYWTDGQFITRQLEQHEIKVLANESVRVAPGLVLLGLDDVAAGKPDVKKTWNGVDPKAAKILLSHNPNAINLILDKDCVLLCGHSHGIPFRAGLRQKCLPYIYSPEYTRGWYREGKAAMYVSRGVGMGFATLLFRPFIPPEVSIFEIRSDHK